MDPKGLAAIVTGGGSGLGAETARQLAQAGAKVAVLDLNEEGVNAVGKEIGGIGVKCDVTSSDSAIAAIAKASADFPLAVGPTMTKSCFPLIA